MYALLLPGQMFNEAQTRTAFSSGKHLRTCLYSCTSWRSSIGTGIQDELFTIGLREYGVSSYRELTISSPFHHTVTDTEKNAPMPHENNEYPYEPALPCNLIWNSLSVQKMHPTPHENKEYPYEPAHPRSLIWTSLSADYFHNKSVFK